MARYRIFFGNRVAGGGGGAGDVDVDVTTNVATTSVGTPTVQAKANVTVTTNLATVSVGQVTIQAKATASPTTNLIAASVDAATVAAEANAFPATNLLTTSVDAATVQGKANVTLTTNAATVSVDQVTVEAGDIDVSATGQALSVAFGPVPGSPENAWDTTGSFGVLTNGNKTITAATDHATVNSETRPATGKHYVEVAYSGANPAGSLSVEGNGGDNVQFILDWGEVYEAPSGTPTYTPAPVVSGDVVGIALDADAGKVWLRVNGGDWNDDAGADPSAGTGSLSIDFPDVFYISTFLYYFGGPSKSATIATGPTFAYAKPSGFNDWYQPAAVTVTGKANVYPTGQALAASVDQVTAGVVTTVTLTTNLITTSVDQATVTGKANVSPTTNVATTSVGAATVSIKANADVTTNLLTASVSGATVQAKATASPTTNLLATSIDQVSVTGKANVSPTTNLATASVSGATIAAKATANVTTNLIAINVDQVTVNVISNIEANVTTNLITTSVGQVDVGEGTGVIEFPRRKQMLSNPPRMMGN